MGLIDEVKQARDAKKQLKREHILSSTIYVIKQGTYKFTYGYNSKEDLQELEEVIDELNNELKKDNFVLKILPSGCVDTYQHYEISVAGKPVGKFNNFIYIQVDAL